MPLERFVNTWSYYESFELGQNRRLPPLCTLPNVPQSHRPPITSVCRDNHGDTTSAWRRNSTADTSADKHFVWWHRHDHRPDNHNWEEGWTEDNGVHTFSSDLAGTVQSDCRTRTLVREIYSHTSLTLKDPWRHWAAVCTEGAADNKITVVGRRTCRLLIMIHDSGSPPNKRPTTASFIRSLHPVSWSLYFENWFCAIVHNSQDVSGDFLFASNYRVL